MCRQIEDEATLLHLLSVLHNFDNNYPANNHQVLIAAEPTALYEHLHKRKEEKEEWLKQPGIIYLTETQKQGLQRGLEDVRMGRVLSDEEAGADLDRFLKMG